MGKLNVFEIVLSNQPGVYFAGQVLQGHVIIDLNEAVKIKGLRITYRGRAFVHWMEQLVRGPGESRFKSIRHHSATEEYFDVSYSLIPRGTGNPDEEKILYPGQYSYPFQFELPANLPSSFEGQHGFLRYWVKVTFEKTWKNDYSTKKVFSVICPMDLNREPTSGNPLQKQKQKSLCCLCCRSGPVSAVLGVQQKGYVPGEAIKISGEVNNNSSRKMGGSSVELKMTTVFHSTHKSQAVTQLVGKIKRGPIAKGDTDVWEGEKLIIPPLPTSFLLGCSIIDIKYIIELKVDPVGPAFDLSVPIEILIGTIPVRSAVQKYIRDNQITPPLVDRVVHPPFPVDRGQGPHSPNYPSSQPSSPDSVFSYGQQPTYPQGSPHLHGPQGQGYDQGHSYGQGYGQGHTYGPNYGHSYAQGHPYGQGHGQGNPNAQPPPGYNQVAHMYPQLSDSRPGYSQGPPQPQGAAAHVTEEWMPTPIFAPYFFGQRCCRDDDDEEDTRGDMYFTPLYVYYEFEQMKEPGSRPARTVRLAT